MGSNQKAKQLLEASGAHKHYSEIVEYALAYFIAKYEKEADPVADDLKRLKGEYAQEFEKAIEVTEEVYCEIFSDEEMDELIVLHTNPAMEKLRGLTGDIFNRVLQNIRGYSAGVSA
jgi:hypothetical protein